MRSANKRLGRAFNALRYLLFPRRCIGCGSPMDGNGADVFCTCCLKQYLQARTYPCPLCGDVIAMCRCVTVGDGKFLLYSLLPYRPADKTCVVSRLLLSRKTRLNPAAEDFLAEQISALCECVISEQGGDCADWILTYPPRSEKKRHEVGHDQSEVLARRLSRLTGIPMLPCMVRVRGADEAQKTLGAAERAENAQGSYLLSTRYAADICGKHVMLIDDIATTGSTLAACASILMGAGAASVVAVTAARTVHEKFD